MDPPIRSTDKDEKRMASETDFTRPCDSSSTIHYNVLSQYRLTSHSDLRAHALAALEPVSPKSTALTDEEHVPMTWQDYLRGGMEEVRGDMALPPLSEQESTASLDSHSPGLDVYYLTRRSMSSQGSSLHTKPRYLVKRASSLTQSTIHVRNITQQGPLPPVSRMPPTRPPSNHDDKNDSNTFQSNTRLHVLKRLRQTTIQRLRSRLTNKPSM